MRLLIALSLLISGVTYAAQYRGLTIADEVNSPAYKRSLCKDGSKSWIDEDMDGENTREEVLAAEKHGNIWVGPFTGRIFTNASDLDIGFSRSIYHQS